MNAALNLRVSYAMELVDCITCVSSSVIMWHLMQYLVRLRIQITSFLLSVSLFHLRVDNVIKALYGLLCCLLTYIISSGPEKPLWVSKRIN